MSRAQFFLSPGFASLSGDTSLSVIGTTAQTGSATTGAGASVDAFGAIVDTGEAVSATSIELSVAGDFSGLGAATATATETIGCVATISDAGSMVSTGSVTIDAFGVTAQAGTATTYGAFGLVVAADDGYSTGGLVVFMGVGLSAASGADASGSVTCFDSVSFPSVSSVAQFGYVQSLAALTLTGTSSAIFDTAPLYVTVDFVCVDTATLRRPTTMATLYRATSNAYQRPC